MEASTIAATKGADAFIFDYPFLDVAYSVTFGSGDWGRYQADGTVVVGQTLTPQIGGVDGVTSLPGTFRTSISLVQLTTYTTARVHYDGSGFTLDYTLNGGTTWTALSEDGVIVLPANADLDLRVTFPGNISNDPAVVNSLAVYVLHSETVNSQTNLRTLTLLDYPVTEGNLLIGATPVTISAVSTSTTTDPTDTTTSTGPADYTISAIELWTTPTTTVFNSAPAGTFYTNGVAGTPVAGLYQHVVLVLTTPANISFGLQASQTVSHLAVYQQAFTATDVLNLYLAHIGPIVTIDDTATISVTESSPATDIYAYAWQIHTVSNS